MEINEENCKSFGNGRKVMKLWINTVHFQLNNYNNNNDNNNNNNNNNNNKNEIKRKDKRKRD